MPIGEKVWNPKWRADQLDYEVGIVYDRDCLIVLLRNGEGEWEPTTNIPVTFAFDFDRLLQEDVFPWLKKHRQEHFGAIDAGEPYHCTVGCNTI